MAANEGKIRRTVLTELAREGFRYVPTGISARHVHLSENDLSRLFGSGYKLTPVKELSQPGQFAAKEQVAVIGPKGELGKVRVLGPVRRETQVELSSTDAVSIGVKNAPVRMSGQLDGTPGIKLRGPKGEIEISFGVIVAARHLHISQEQARIFRLHDGQVVSLKAEGPRGGILENVVCRAGDGHELKLHVDTDEANAFGLENGSILQLIVRGEETNEEKERTLDPERTAKRAVFALTGQSGNYISTPKVPDAVKQTIDTEELLDLVTEQDINIAAGRGLDHVNCCKKALITPAAADRAAALHIEIIRKSGAGAGVVMTPSADEEILELVTAGDLNVAFRDDKKEIYCTKDALITPAAMERMAETGIRIIRV